VSFFGADGAPIGDPTTVQLKAGESTSVPAVRPSKLVRAIVSIDDVIDSAKLSALRTRVEIFDVQTDTIFVSVSGEAIGSNNECGVSAARALGAARKNVAGRKNSLSVATSSSLTVGDALAPKLDHPNLPTLGQPRRDDFKTRACPRSGEFSRSPGGLVTSQRL